MSSNRVSINSLLLLLNEATGRDFTAKKALVAEWALEAERKIGTGMAFNKVTGYTLDVQHHRAHLPANCYSVNEVNYCILQNACTCGQTPCSCSSCTCGTSSDSTHTVLSNAGALRPYCSCGSYYYKTKSLDYSIEGCFLTLPYPTGRVTIDYLELPVDETGMLLITLSHRDAILSFCVYSYMQSQYNVGRIKESVLNTVRDRWFDLCSQSRGKDNMPSRQRSAYAAEINNDGFKFRRRY